MSYSTTVQRSYGIYLLDQVLTKQMEYGSSLIACLWSYDGWGDLNFMQEELISPQQDFKRTILVSIAIVTLAYLLSNLAYLSILNTEIIKDSTTIAIDVGNAFDRRWNTSHLFTICIALGVALSTAGSLNGSIMTGGRIFFAVSRDKNAPAAFSKLNKSGSPYLSIIALGISAIVLVLLPGSNFSTLLDYFGPMSWFYYALVSSTVIVLRFKEPERIRPYRALLYPLPPVLVIIIASIIMISSLINEPVYTTLAISCVLISIPIYYIFYYNKSYQESIDQSAHSSHPLNDQSEGKESTDPSNPIIIELSTI